MILARVLVGLTVVLLCAGCGGKQDKQDAAQSSQATSQAKPADNTQAATNAAPAQTPAGAPAQSPAQTPAQEQAATPAPPPAKSPDKPASTAGKKIVTTATGLKYVDFEIGTGAVAAAGHNVSVHYTGWLANGNKFDSSLDRGQPISFELGSGRVIPGWDQGISGMKVGGKRQLIIPSQLGYGAQGRPPVIPPNSTLIFDVQLMGVQ